MKTEKPYAMKRKRAAVAALALICVAAAGRCFSNPTASADSDKPQPSFVLYATTVVAPARFKSVAIVSQ